MKSYFLAFALVLLPFAFAVDPDKLQEVIETYVKANLKPNAFKTCFEESCCRAEHPVDFDDIPELSNVMAPRQITYYLCAGSCSPALPFALPSPVFQRECKAVGYSLNSFNVIYNHGPKNVTVVKHENFFARSCHCH